MANEARPRRENPFANLLINVILPILILQQLTRRLGEQGPLIALILAMALPIGYGLWDFVRNRHKNYFSLFGLLSIMFTGGFALFHLSGGWFAIKEAAFPAVMAAGTAVSALTSRPLMASLFCNDQLLHMDRLEQALVQSQNQMAFRALLRRATLWLSLSFVLSSVLNYIIALRIFVPLDPALTESARSEVLNQQIASMTGWGSAMIMVPMMIFTGVVLYFFLKKLGHLTGLKLEELMKT